MPNKLCRIAPIAALLALALAPSANADVTLGSVGPPAGSSPNSCGGFVIAPLVSTTGTPFIVPPGGGAITQWQTNTTGALAGQAVTFLVLRPTAGNLYTAVAVDTRALPNPLPGDNIATFALAAPVTVAAGDTLGLSSTTFPNCFWDQGSTPLADGAVAMSPNGPLQPGQTFTPFTLSGAGTEMNVAATLAVREDVAVSAGAVPKTTSVGTQAVLSSLVTNNGPSSMPITVNESVASGLTIDSAAAGSGSCITNGQLVTCTITNLAPGQSVPVDIVVTPTSAKSYTSTVLAQSNVPDPNAANNSAFAVLTAQAAATSASQCIVPNLRSVRGSLAKKMLGLLGCHVGKVKRVHSKGVPKGAVIKTTPRAGTYVAGKIVNLQVSSGPGGHKHH
jgi:hypothetical protein